MASTRCACAALAQAPVARHRDAVAGLENGLGMARLAVAVDDQARVGGEHGRRIEPRRQAPRHLGGADVPGDVSVEDLRIEAQAAEGARDGPAGMVADEQHGGAAVRVEDREGRRLAGADQRRDGLGNTLAHGRTIAQKGPPMRSAWTKKRLADRPESLYEQPMAAAHSKGPGAAPAAGGGAVRSALAALVCGASASRPSWCASASSGRRLPPGLPGAAGVRAVVRPGRPAAALAWILLAEPLSGWQGGGRRRRARWHCPGQARQPMKPGAALVRPTAGRVPIDRASPRADKEGPGGAPCRPRTRHSSSCR